MTVTASGWSPCNGRYKLVTADIPILATRMTISICNRSQDPGKAQSHIPFYGPCLSSASNPRRRGSSPTLTDASTAKSTTSTTISAQWRSEALGFVLPSDPAFRSCLFSLTSRAFAFSWKLRVGVPHILCTSSNWLSVKGCHTYPEIHS